MRVHIERKPRYRGIELRAEVAAALASRSRDELVLRETKGMRDIQPGDVLWVREPHRWIGKRYASPVPEEYAEEPGELDWSCAEIEWQTVNGRVPGNWWEVVFPDDFMYGRAFSYEETEDPMYDEGPDVATYLSEWLPARRMPRWASRITLLVREVVPLPDGRLSCRFETIVRNVDDLLGKPRRDGTDEAYRIRRSLTP